MVNNYAFLRLILLVCWEAVATEGFGSGGFANIYQDTSQLQSGSIEADGASSFFQNADAFETEFNELGDCERGSVEAIIKDKPILLGDIPPNCPIFETIADAITVAGRGNEPDAALALFETTLAIENSTESAEFFFNLDLNNTSYEIENSTSPSHMYDEFGCNIQIITKLNSAGDTGVSSFLDSLGRNLQTTSSTDASLASFFSGISGGNPPTSPPTSPPQLNGIAPTVSPQGNDPAFASSSPTVMPQSGASAFGGNSPTFAPGESSTIDVITLVQSMENKIIGERSDPQCIANRVAQVTNLKTTYDTRNSTSNLVTSAEFALAIMGVIMGVVICLCSVLIFMNKDKSSEVLAKGRGGKNSGASQKADGDSETGSKSSSDAGSDDGRDDDSDDSE